MMRQTYLNYIEEKLSTLATRIKNNGKLNLLNLHQHSENFHRDLLTEVTLEQNLIRSQASFVGVAIRQMLLAML
jgi:hypothetical protein